MVADGTLYEWLRLVVWGCFLYLFANYLLFAVLALVGAFESAHRRWQSRSEDFESMSLSRFTIPVSLVVPAFNEASVITGSLDSLLALDYPELEVIVVNDGSDDETLETLQKHFDLELRHVFYRRVIPTRAIRGVYRSRRERRLLVVDKINGGKADSLNCGINFARYRYVCCVDADTIFEPNALLQAMRLIVKDPATIVGLTSFVAVSSNPRAWRRSGDGAKEKDRGILSSLQHFDFARSFLNNRIAWSRFRFMLCNSGAFAVWRRDVVLELGGFSPRFTCEDIEMTFRAHERFMRDKQQYRILCTPEIVAVTESPDRLGDLVRQRARWQRVINETLWHYRKMLLRPRYRSVGLVGMPYYLVFEIFTPFVEMLALLTLPLAWYLGVLSWRELLMFVASVSLANGILTNWSLMLDDRRARRYSVRSHASFLVVALLDYALYRPIIFVARWQGLIGFLRGDKRWHKFERNERSATAT
jgi:cellulose synthase/poly-beta-1,6-N-acetylglucosamine synthase-like glycosyltransferase